jgi:hypothetical protein
MRDLGALLESSAARLKSVDESIRVFGFKIDKPFVSKIIAMITALIISWITTTATQYI